MDNEIKEILKVDKQLLDKIEYILSSELNCEEYDKFYNYFNEIRKPNILVDIKDDENIKDYITNLEQKCENQRLELVSLNDRLKEVKKSNGYLKQENERYKRIFEVKERFSKIMPEDIDFIILSKADYDRQQEDIELNAIELKSRIDKAIEYIEARTFDDVCIAPFIHDFNFKENILNILKGDNND